MSSIDELGDDLRIASKILEWEIGDIWGHVGVRIPEDNSIAVKLFRVPDEGDKDRLIVHFDYSLTRLSGTEKPPGEATIYTEIFKARPDVNAVVHAHAPMCVALSMANKKIGAMHMQSKQYAGGVPIFPKPIFILDDAEGAELAGALGQAVAVVIRGHGVVTVGTTIKEACMQALYLERTAKMQAIANALGFQGVDDEFLRQMGESVKKMDHRIGRPERRERDPYALEWTYYRKKVEKGEYWSRGWV
jgi:ribulose-5-phosphate 4-epimerase/fuculose-1-phosphate aldolase